MAKTVGKAKTKNLKDYEPKDAAKDKKLGFKEDSPKDNKLDIKAMKNTKSKSKK